MSQEKIDKHSNKYDNLKHSISNNKEKYDLLNGDLELEVYYCRSD